MGLNTKLFRLDEDDIHGEVTEVQDIIDVEGVSNRVQGLELEMRKYFFSKLKSSLLNNATFCAKPCQSHLSIGYVISKAVTIEYNLFSRSKTGFEYKYSASRQIAEFERLTAEGKLCEELKGLENDMVSSSNSKVSEASTESSKVDEFIHPVNGNIDDILSKTENHHSPKAEGSTGTLSTPTIISNVLLSSKFDLAKIQQSYGKIDTTETVEKFNDPSESNQTSDCENDEKMSITSYLDWNDNDLALSYVQAMDTGVTTNSSDASLKSEENFLKKSDTLVTVDDKNTENDGVSYSDESCIQLDEEPIIPQTSVKTLCKDDRDCDFLNMKRMTMSILRPIIKAYYLTELMPNKSCSKHIFRQIHWDVLLKHLHDEREIKRYAIDTIKSKKYLCDKINKTRKWRIQS
ncbi:hypothetical protein QAD02_019800 [Eretmocerus hayati]|uniref:Uncharacterized protein n=1 Tax=Eretmocerus hayati TaxID=131215 RepID=A0ACC2PKK9_9HYME|nr:hypothetical protein QAD02_019800 [Eretmocerus hayati]